MWYVNADGQEGWVPSDILQLMTDEDTESSRESTPQSAEMSAESSEVSDDGKSRSNTALSDILYFIYIGNRTQQW